jgi:mannitol-1-/sugar-/sorbitol-6-phosphatase
MSVTLSCDAILFDLDGVLVDSSEVVQRTWNRWAALRGVHEPDLVQRAHGRRSVETVRAVAPHLDAAREVEWLATVELADLEGIVALPGASSVFQTVTDSQRAIVTSGGRELARRRLERVRLPVPNVLIAAEDVSEGKPSPEGYLQGALRLGRSPSRCVVIEDTPAGVQAGRAAGATVLALSTTFPKEALGGADVVVDSLASVQLGGGARKLVLRVG